MITKLLVKAILEHAEQYKWSLQGFGMLRLYLSDEVRLHVWDDRYRVPNVSDIHDHPWDFASRVVVGSLIDLRYHVVYGSEHPTHLLSKLRCGIGGGLAQEETIRCSLMLANKWTYRSGEEYFGRSERVHRSIPENGTVTIVTRIFKEDRDHANVFWPLGTSWVSAEPREATPDEVRDITRASLEKWFRD